VINQCVRDEMKKLLGDIQSGRFADEWMAECESGKPRFKQLESQGLEHPIEIVGARLRGMMPWLKQRQLVNRATN
jgi:ketol-acid reductoisomerase